MAGSKGKNFEIRGKKVLADILYNKKSEVIDNKGHPKYTKISEIMKKEYNINITRQTIARWVDTDNIAKYKDFIAPENDEHLKEIREQIETMKEISKNGESEIARVQATNSYKGLKAQELKYIQDLEERKLKQAEISRPNFLIKFKPESAERTCPVCGHKWFDVGGKRQTPLKNGKQVTKDCKEQKTFDELAEGEK